MFYICPICGNVIYVMNGDIKRVRCCGKEMLELSANSEDASVEKHVPYCSVNDKVVEVRIGETIHPMEEEHYIMWIAMVSGEYVTIKHLSYSDSPEAIFEYKEDAVIYAYCNKHGLWKKEL